MVLSSPTLMMHGHMNLKFIKDKHADQPAKKICDTPPYACGDWWLFNSHGQKQLIFKNVCICTMFCAAVQSTIWNYNADNGTFYASTYQIHTTEHYTGCHRRKGPNFGRVFLMLNYTDITQNTYIQSLTVTEIMAREVWNFDSCYTLTDCQIHIETGSNRLCGFCNVNICT